MAPSVKVYESNALRTVTGPAIRPGGMALTERALAFCALTTGAPVLDVGCGTGATAAHLRRAHGLDAVGLDLSWPLLSEGRAHCGAPLIRGRAEVLPFRHGRLSALFCECALSLLSSPETALVEWHRVLAPGGFLVLSDLYERNGGAAGGLPTTEVQGCLAGAAGRLAIQAWVERAGFDVRLFEDHTPMLKQLAARLVWAHGSLDAFWSTVGGGCGGGRCGGRPGYYLMVARKGGKNDG